MHRHTILTVVSFGALFALAAASSSCESKTSDKKSAQPGATKRTPAPTQTTERPAASLKDITLAVSGMT